MREPGKVIHSVVVVGGGPAGMMAAIRAAECGSQVTLIEQNPALGRKLLLSGKGRCNLTNLSDLGIFLGKFSHHPEFLRDAFGKFFNKELIAFFNKHGLSLVVERQERVFPQNAHASSVLKVLEHVLRALRVRILYDSLVKDVVLENNRVGALILANLKRVSVQRLILATGGVTYRFTGSCGTGIEIAQRLGHRIVPLRAGLVPLDVAGNFPKELEGLVLKNIRLEFSDGKRKLESDIGELLFTHTGISGPLVLSLSGKVVDWLAEGKSVRLGIDLKPGLSFEQMDQRFLREFCMQARCTIKNVLKDFLPARFIDVFMKLAGIDPAIKANQVSAVSRIAMIKLFKRFPLEISRGRPLENAMVTRGGVSLRQINPRTMESRLVAGLYFAGEMIDLDADTGGFNLQAAFSTGYLAGESAARL